jgi:ribonuclease P protein component
MPDGKTYTLPKKERLYGKRIISKLFGANSRSMSVFPLRAVYSTYAAQENTAQTRIMISAPKKNLKLAVDRNRVKRQIREAYRRNKHCLTNENNACKQQVLMIAFIWMDKKPWPSHEVEKKVRNLIQRIAEKTYGC